MNKLVVGILMGGISSEREVSLNTGREVFKYLDKEKYDIICIEWEKDNTWTKYANNSLIKAKKYTTVNELFMNTTMDIIFIALHGKNGEDGRIQGYFDTIGLAYTGSGVLSSAIGMNKIISKQLFFQNNILSPKYLYYSKKQLKQINKIHQDISSYIKYPCFIKPNNSGSSVGITKVKNEKELRVAIEKAFIEDDYILIEEYIEGVEVSVAVIGNYLDDNRFALPVIEIIPTHEYFDYDSKYEDGMSMEIVPARISKKLELNLKNIAIKVHDLFLCESYSRTDMLIKKENVYVLEINTLPGMTNNSLYPKMAEEIGITYTQLLDKLIDLKINN